jgi:hypothetical protein
MPDQDRNTNELVVPEAKDALEQLKIETANEVMAEEMGGNITSDNYEARLDEYKYEVADNLGLKEKIDKVGWENMTTREVGKIGGQMGGKIGGNMVKKMITMAEENMLNQRKTDK